MNSSAPGSGIAGVHGGLLVIVADETVGNVGSGEFDPTEPTIGNTLGVGIAAKGLTPRLAISQESIGIPVLGKPPGVVEVVDIGLDDDEAIPLEPTPHIPDNDTGPVAVTDDIPGIGSVPWSVDIADVAEGPTAAAVAVVADPIVIPPPS